MKKIAVERTPPHLGSPWLTDTTRYEQQSKRSSANCLALLLDTIVYISSISSDFSNVAGL